MYSLIDSGKTGKTGTGTENTGSGQRECSLKWKNLK